MGLQAIGAILNAVGQIPKPAAALVTQRIKGAIAEQAIEGFGIRSLMAGKILAFPILEKFVIGHITPLSRGIPSAADGQIPSFHRFWDE